MYSGKDYGRAQEESQRQQEISRAYDHGKITEGIFVEDIWKGDKPHNDYTFEGERIRGIMPYSIGAYKVRFDDQPWIIMDKWRIWQAVK